MVKDLLVILIASSLVNNVVLSQFLGLCPFLGVSKKTNTATGMGVAVIFVITLASAVAGAIYKFILVPLDITYLQTIVFILVIAALVQFVEMFLKKFIPSLYQSLGVYLPLITTNCAVLGVALTNVQKSYGIGTGIFSGNAHCSCYGRTDGDRFLRVFRITIVNCRLCSANLENAAQLYIK